MPPMEDPTVKAVRIAMGVAKRTTKELSMYAKEAKGEATKLEQMRATNQGE